MKTAPAPVSHVKQVFTSGALHAMLPQLDVVIVIVPHTPVSEQMLGAAEIAVMRNGTFFVNIGRGSTVDEVTLIPALRSEKRGAAALDFFTEEPLPDDSLLWGMGNVLIRPHSASTSDRENARIAELFCDNLRRNLDGCLLRHVLDVEQLS